MAWQAWVIRGAILGGTFIYHRFLQKEPTKPKPARAIDVPRTDEGAPYALIYGRCRVRSPIVSWAGAPTATPGDEIGLIAAGQPFVYSISQVIVLGIPFQNGTNRVHSFYVGDLKLTTSSPSADQLEDLTGEGAYECLTTNVAISSTFTAAETALTGGNVEFLNGNSSQNLVDPVTFEPLTVAGQIMIEDGIAGSAVPGYRGKLAVCLFGGTAGGFPGTINSFSWRIGASPTVLAYQFECSSYPAGQYGPEDRVGVEANPVDVLVDLLIARFGKLGMPGAYIDVDSFAAAAFTLHSEAHGYSRSLEDGDRADAVIAEILEQIDAVMYPDQSTGKLKLKLIRGDYDPTTVPVIGPSTCVRVADYSIAGQTGVVNAVRVVFSDRQRHYRDNSATAQSMANAVGQDGILREHTVQMPGVCTKALAETLAARELGALGRPLSRCRALVDRSFYPVNPGDVVALTWPEWGIDGKLFRVASVDHGELERDAIELGLIEDLFHSHRGLVVTTPPVAGFPVEATD